jgi:hypothetical protein
MNYEDRVVCFLDILGFGGHIACSIQQDGSDANEKIRELSDVFANIREILEIDRPAVRRDKEVTQFSDSIVISFPAYTESGVFFALQDILWVQISLAQKGYLCRGGVTRGRLIHTPTVLFGPAMVEAYTLESKSALYPRVILDAEIINTGVAAHALHHLPIHEEQSILSLLKRDLDGMYYINYITGAQVELDDPELDYPGYLHQLRKLISEGILAKDPSVAIKYKWLREKLVDHLRIVKENARKQAVSDDLREAYESIQDL